MLSIFRVNIRSIFRVNMLSIFSVNIPNTLRVHHLLGPCASEQAATLQHTSSSPMSHGVCSLDHLSWKALTLLPVLSANVAVPAVLTGQAQLHLLTTLVIVLVPSAQQSARSMQGKSCHLRAVLHEHLMCMAQ